jgi:hypothetical protein
MIHNGNVKTMEKKDEMDLRLQIREVLLEEMQNIRFEEFLLDSDERESLSPQSFENETRSIHNTNVERLMTRVVTGRGLFKINQYVRIGVTGYSAGSFYFNLKGKRIYCRAIDIGNLNPSGHYNLWMYPGQPVTSSDIMNGSTLIGRTYKYNIKLENGVWRNDFWLAVEARSIRDFELIY